MLYIFRGQRYTNILTPIPQHLLKKNKLEVFFMQERYIICIFSSDKCSFSFFFVSLQNKLPKL